MAKKQPKVEEEIKSPLSMEDLFIAQTPEEKRADRMVAIAQQQLQTSIRYKEHRMAEIAKNEDLYYGKTKKALKGRWNVPLPLMSGFVDTLLSKTDDPPRVKYGYQDVADMERAQKTQAKWDQESVSVKNKWSLKDRMEKKIATFSGVGISKTYAFNDEKGNYVSVYDVIDYLDFECEPMGGQILADHIFKGQRNIFKTKDQLQRAAMGDNPIYNKKQVLKLIMAAGGGRLQKEFQRLYIEKTDRLRALGFNTDMGSYVGIPIYNMVEWYMEDPENGEKYYLFFEPHSGIWVRGCPLKEVFASDTDPYEAWHTHPDPFNFWSKAPADDMRPVAEAMNIIFNQALDERDRKIYHMRAYDPDMFPDPAQLEWRPDGLVEVASGSTALRAIGNGIHELKIEGVSEASTINLMTFMDQLAGTKTGVSPASQGAGEDKRVAIYFGNLQQVADRLGLYNKSYSEAWGSKGLKFYWGLKEHITNDGMMVRMIGDKGYNWTTLTKEDLNPTRDFDVTIIGGQAEAAADEILKKTKAAALASLMMNPAYAPRLNPEVVIEETLRNGGWEEGDTKRFLDNQTPGSEIIISQAHQAIQEILEGKTPKKNRGATTLFMQEIIDFCDQADDLDLDTYMALMDYAKSHVDVVVENAVRKARLTASVEAAKIASAGGGAPVDAGTKLAGEAVTSVPGSPTVDTLGFTGAPITPEGARSLGATGQ